MKKPARIAGFPACRPSSDPFWTRWLPFSKRVANGYSVASRSCRTELSVVVDEVKVSFRTNKEVSSRVEPETRSKMTQKVVATGVVGATREAATVEGLVEATALRADSSH